MGAVIVVALLGVPTLYLVRSIVRQQRVRWPRLTMWVPILYIVSALLPAAFVSWFYSFPFEDLDLADRPERSWRNNPNDPVVVAWIYLLPGWLWLLNVLRMCFRPSKPRQMTAAIVVALVLLWFPIQLIAPYIDAPRSSTDRLPASNCSPRIFGRPELPTRQRSTDVRSFVSPALAGPWGTSPQESPPNACGSRSRNTAPRSADSEQILADLRPRVIGRIWGFVSGPFVVVSG